MTQSLLATSERAFRDTLGVVVEIFLRRDHAGRACDRRWSVPVWVCIG